ncbi:MAG: hypothetical protein GY801_26165 [bacterium]|nr:hypothetical protein [bacterium]
MCQVFRQGLLEVRLKELQVPRSGSIPAFSSQGQPQGRSASETAGRERPRIEKLQRLSLGGHGPVDDDVHEGKVEDTDNDGDAGH